MALPFNADAREKLRDLRGKRIAAEDEWRASIERGDDRDTHREIARRYMVAEREFFTELSRYLEPLVD